MNKQEIFDKISAYLEESFEVPRAAIVAEASLYQDLGIDSIDAIDLIVKLQELTNKKISPANFKEVRTVGNLIDKVHEMMHD